MRELWEIYLKFFKMGAVTFGGGYAMLPILRREVVEKSGWLDEEDILDFYALSQGLPGIIAINTGAFIGYRRRRIPGAAAAALGVVSPSVIIISVIAFFLAGFKDNVYVQRALSAISVCVVALIADAVIGMWKKGVKDTWGILICLAVLVMSLFTPLSPVLFVVLSAAAGIVIRAVARSADPGKGGGAK